MVLGEGRMPRSGATEEGPPSEDLPLPPTPSRAPRGAALHRCTCFEGMGSAGGTGGPTPPVDLATDARERRKGALRTRTFGEVYTK